MQKNKVKRQLSAIARLEAERDAYHILQSAKLRYCGMLQIGKVLLVVCWTKYRMWNFG
jgi:hypothetical protein